MPVPAALPPRPSTRRPSRERRSDSVQFSTQTWYAENSWPSVIGTASWRCVRPDLRTWRNACALSEKAVARRSICSSAGPVMACAAIRMAVGMTSFVDCAMFTWSFGLTSLVSPRAPPRISQARFAITSFTFMWNDVPAPAW